MLSQKRKISLISIVLIAIFSAVTLNFVLTQSNVLPKTNITVYGAGTPDAYGNRIVSLYFYQYISGSWSASSVTFSTYTPSMSIAITSSVNTYIDTFVWLNYSMAADAATAMTNTAVYLTISGVTTSTSMTAILATPVGTTSWQVLFRYPSASYWTPSSGTNYTVSLTYQALY